MNQEQTLYDRIGGTPTIQKLIDKLYERVLADEELGLFFTDTDLKKVLKMQYEFFGAALDGPVNYTGLELGHVHQGRGITRKHFGKYVELLFATLKDLEIDQKDSDAIIDRVNLYVDDIVGGRGAGG